MALRLPTKTKADLFSNDYLSLANDPRVRARLRVLDRLSTEPEAILGSTGSRLLDGNTKTHINFEERLRYDANLSLFGTLPQEGDVFVYDELVHASILDGFRLSSIPSALYPFKHYSVESLRDVLQGIVASLPNIRSVYVALETVHSMHGDIAPLPDIVETVEQTLPHGCGQILIDESHSTGLYGSGGRGIVNHFRLEKRMAFQLHTFSKTLASSGAVLLTSPTVRAYLINFARPFIYSTSITRVCLLATEASLEIVEGEIGDQLRQRLSALTRELINVPSHVLRLSTPKEHKLQTSVIPLLTPHAIHLCMRLRARGWAAIPIFPPVVPRGEERIRFIIHAGNTERQINEFIYDVLDIQQEHWTETPGAVTGIIFDEKPRRVSQSLARL
ncbi:PLP-dependent transferase [Ramaria rubella]|nr:PLP-dependent transferase [Ramaria rubella]